MDNRKSDHNESPLGIFIPTAQLLKKEEELPKLEKIEHFHTCFCLQWSCTDIATEKILSCT